MANSADSARNRFDTSRATAPRVFQPAEGMEVHGLKLVRQLGAGAMGEVWLAIDPTRAGDDQAGYVAAKFLPPELQRVKREWKRVERVFCDVQGLQHPGICPVYQLHTNSLHGPCLVMKYIEAQTLMEWRDEYVDEHSSFPLSVAIPVLRKIAEALDYAHDPEHAAGHKVPRVIHRDIKPENILVTADGKGVQLVDFGIASRLRQTMVSISNRPLDSSGTRPYMAPEQWRCEETDARTDQYALGVVAYELLADRLPFEALDHFALERAVLERPVPFIKEQPDHVNVAIARAMAKQPEERFLCCLDFVATLALADSTPNQPVKEELVAVTADQTPTASADLQSTQSIELPSVNTDEVCLASPSSIAGAQAQHIVESVDGVEPDNRDLAACNAAWRDADEAVLDASCTFGDIEAELLNEQQRRVELLKTFVPTSQTVHAQDQKIAAVTSQLEGQQRDVVEKLAERDRADAAVCEAIETQIVSLDSEVSRLTDSNGIGYHRESPAVRQVLAQIDELRTRQQPHLPGMQRHQGKSERVRVREFLEEPANLTRSRTTSLGIELLQLPAGQFLMGSSNGEDSEKPEHLVRISRRFWMGKFPVIIGQVLRWLNHTPQMQLTNDYIKLGDANCPVKYVNRQYVLNTSSPFGQSEDQPMVLISWIGAMAYCEWATQNDPDFTYTLPTEAQWEYACRAGTTTAFYFGEDGSQIGKFAWYKKNSHGVTHSAGKKPANPWGLHDLAGNVWEWCSDWYDGDWYT
ncbi:MAG: SUMF1/EgtB/PvdO family nonheme iron enzyme, partial [Rhodopirellula sp.]|nr:SUMF1/EgtB/PvdO family nonheme iron enzyme [Rhodopirellula sp.]